MPWFFFKLSLQENDRKNTNMMMMWEMEAEDATEHLGPIRNW